MRSHLTKLASRAALHHRYEPDISWFKAWQMALTVPIERMKQGRLARQAMARYDLPGAQLSFISASGNLVYRVEAKGRIYALRISPPGRRTVEQVRAELAFAADLQQRASIHTPQAMPARNGDPVQVLADHDGATRLVVLFTWLAGESLGERPSPDRMEQLGHIQARLHALTLSGTQPYAKDRPVLTAEEVMGWTHPPHRAPNILSDADQTLVDRMDAHLRKIVPPLFERYPKALVHFDLQGSNLLVNGDEIGIIDLDGCLVAPILLDVSTTLAYTTTKPDADALRAAWMKGYSSIRAMEAPMEGLLDAAMALIALREVQRVLAWPNVTSRPWGPAVLETSLQVLRTLSARMGLAPDA